ncbi:mitochondrial ornithine transporter 1 [Phlebotomus argentipes]|uniref:mitochondrial ornithine transporter 1 n=1 Tax=Phlebotomus argentipes TaxID=94469 RepID=UPI002892E1D5|nr:mitochondrial ornithine transporter 1 [Phlebotomus argentipes]
MRGSTESGGLKTGVIDFTAGSLGGVALVYVSQPLDTCKVKMQTFPTFYRGMIHCLIETFRKDGIWRGLYAGSIPAVVANVAENSVLFAGYGACQKLVAVVEKKDNIKDLSLIGNATAGFLAAFFSSFTLCPTELVKCKLQALREMHNQQKTTQPDAKLSHISPYRLTRDILRKEGIPGLFRGLTSTFAREMPGYFFFFGGYEGARQLMTKPGQSKDDIGPLRTMAAGAFGGVVLWTVIFPADVIKSRIQVASLRTSMTQVGLQIYRTEGLLALYNGLLPSVIRTIPATAVLFLVYEYSKKLMTELF